MTRIKSTIRRLSVAALIVFGMLVPTAALAGVRAVIDLSEQEMTVYVNGWPRHTWPVSTGRPGYPTPTGSFQPIRLERKWFSRKYDWAPMPHSVFFRGGYAIHGTTEIRRLGHRASHGCVRLHPDNAATLFGLIERYGKANSRIVISR